MPNLSELEQFVTFAEQGTLSSACLLYTSGAVVQGTETVVDRGKINAAGCQRAHGQKRRAQ